MVAKLDTMDLAASLRCYNAWNLEFKTIMFVSVDPNDALFIQLWAVGVNSTTRITADGIKRKHVSSVIESCRSASVQALLRTIDSVFGVDSKKLYIGPTLLAPRSPTRPK